MGGVLADLRVVDFGQYIAGPLAAMLLADQGADVIRVDPPGGPRWDTPANAIWNRGKRAISLDLKTPEGLATATALVARADVVIENFRPGVMSRLGLDSAALCQAHRHLVWCALPGFGKDDPRAALPAWEGVLGAATGRYTLKVQVERDDAGRRLPHEADDRPIYSTIPVSSVFGGCIGAMSTAMALVARQRDGRGQRIEVPLFDATFAAIGTPRWAGKPGTPWMRSYECADGRWIDLMGYNGRFVRSIIEEADVAWWLEQPFVGNVDRPFRTTPDQATELLARMESLFRTRTALKWEAALSDAGVPIAVCRTTADWLATSAARESEAIIARDDPRLGPTLQPGISVGLSETPGAISRPAPLPDQHREEILAEIAALPPRTEAPASAPDDRPPLADLRVVDLGTVLVGPSCGRTLAEFGADVVKIDTPAGAGPDPDVSRGKRSMMLNIKTPPGLDALLRLADRADIVLQNFRMGVAERGGYGYDQLSGRRPGLVYLSFNLYGRKGPWRHRPGFENQAEAATGMQERFGGAGHPAKEPLPVNDYGAALLGAFGVALALYHRNGRGKGAGQHVHTALTWSASLMQSEALIDHPGKVATEPRGQMALGSSALHRAYEASDGWLFLAARQDQIADLDAVAGLAGIADQPVKRLAMFLETRFRATSVAEWIRCLERAGVGVHRVDTIREVMAHPYASARGLYLEREHPDGGTIATIGPIPQLSHTPIQAGRPLRPTMDAREILGELDLADRLDRYLSEGVVEIRPPRRVATAVST